MRLYWNQAKEGGGEMSPSERQAAIWDIVYQQRYETVPNLAHTFGVSTRTIYTDLGKMKGKYLIDVIPGRYGGVYLALEPTNIFKYLTKEQEKTLQDLLPSQPAEIHCILQSILDAFARKHP